MDNCTCKRGDKPQDCPVHMRFWVGKDDDDDDREISDEEYLQNYDGELH